MWRYIKNKNKIIKTFLIVLIISLAFVSFAKSFLQLQNPFIDTTETNELKASQYLISLNNNSSIIYSNHNYPVYAYYTRMKVNVLIDQDQHFYRVFPKNMKERGYFIYYNSVNKEPNKEWLDSNKNFKRLKQIGDIIIYEYSPKKE